MFAGNYGKRVAQMWGLCGHAYIYWYMYTFQPWCGTRREVIQTFTQDHTVHTFLTNYAKRMEQICGVGLTWIHLLMHVHMLTLIWDQMRDDWKMHMGPHSGTHVCIQLSKGLEQTWEVRCTCIHVLIHVHV